MNSGFPSAGCYMTSEKTTCCWPIATIDSGTEWHYLLHLLSLPQNLMREPCRNAQPPLPTTRLASIANAPMFFLTPRHVKYGREFVKDARKLLAYKRDLLSDATIADFEAGIAKLEDAVKSRESGAIEAAAAALDTQCGAFVKPHKDAGLRENCEVFLVAIVVALGVRTYFLQPFTIPTGSMFPTLNGIIGKRTTEPPPNIVTRFVQFAWYGRTYVNVIAKTDDVINVMSGIREVKTFPLTNWDIPPRLATRTLIVGQRNNYFVDCPSDTLRQYLLQSGSEVKAGDVIARGYYNTGDHVFVDKISYNFRTPKSSEVFVFNTQRLPTIDRRRPMDYGLNNSNNPTEFDQPVAALLADQRHMKIDMTVPSQFYIKRLVGTPGDTLAVRSPELLINKEVAKGFAFGRVMAAKDGYAGYGYGREDFLLPNLRQSRDGSKESEPYCVPEKHYFAMGDNSYNSSDSRDWGAVPQQNIMGRGVFVYWPFTPHFGIIR